MAATNSTSFDKDDLIVRLERILGVLDCVEFLGDPQLDLDVFGSPKEMIHSITEAIAGARSLVFEVQKILVESHD